MKKNTRYRVLRRLGCDPFTAGSIAFLNFMWNVTDGKIGFMNVIIDYDTEEPK